MMARDLRRSLDELEAAVNWLAKNSPRNGQRLVHYFRELTSAGLTAAEAFRVIYREETRELQQPKTEESKNHG